LFKLRRFTNLLLGGFLHFFIFFPFFYNTFEEIVNLVSHLQNYS
jgi:hypothetical protein